jgi:lysophospholipase L1-like esterase
MKMLVAVLAITLLIYIGYEIIRIRHLVHVGIQLAAEAHSYEKAEGRRSMLVLGDSTAVGVGAKPAETVAARLGMLLQASVESHAKSGAVTTDLAKQLGASQRDTYDVILVQIGANDVIRFHSPGEVSVELERVLETAKKKSEHVIVLTAGKIGNAPVFPRLLAPLVTYRANQLRHLFKSSSKRHGAVYVDLFAAPDPFTADPVRYYAADGLHLTGEGYGFWYSEVEKAIRDRWPEIID